MSLRLPIALVAALALALSGCDERAAASQPDAAPPPSAPAPSASAPSARPSASAADGGAAPRPPETPSIEVLKLVFTSDVKNKDPVDKIERAQPGQRVYAHLTMRNRGAEARPIALVFKVNGEQRTKVDLKVEPSWSYRTWGYVTLRASDLTGALAVNVLDDAGTVLAKAALPILKPGDKPPKPKPEPEPLEP